MKNLLILGVAVAGLAGAAPAPAEAAPVNTLPTVAHINETTVVVRTHHRRYRTVRRVYYRHGRRVVVYRRVYY